MAEDIRAFMEEHWLYSAAVIGHSMGGKVAMTLAFEYPDLVSRLAIIDIAPKRYSGGHENVFDALTTLNLATLESRKQAEDYISARITDRPTVQFLMKNLSRDEQTGHFEWKMNLPVITKFYQDILSPPTNHSTYVGPTLFVRGGNSSYVTDADIPDIRRHFPAMQLVTVPAAGHWVHAEAPQALLTHLIDFL
jgi:pimeloyl-ACP methyl ester carboxylesterase